MLVSVLLSISSDIKLVDNFCNVNPHLFSKAWRFVNSVLMNLASQFVFHLNIIFLYFTDEKKS